MTHIKKLLKKVYSLFVSAKNDGPAERFYYKYTGELDDTKKVNAALQSQWTAHYMIYRQFLKVAEPVTTIDICCGSGAGTKCISETLDVKVIGIDYSGEAIDFARNNNSNSSIIYEKFDLRKAVDLNKIKDLIAINNVRQAFFIEGIEHLSMENAEKIIKLLFDNRISRIFISTPFEKEGKLPEVHHMNPFTPSRFEQFSMKFHIKSICYLKYVTLPDVMALIEKGYDGDEILRQYITYSKEQAGSFLMEIDTER